MLLWLTDFGSLPTVRDGAKAVLDCLPTYNQVLQDLGTALQGPQAGADLQRLLDMQQADELIPGLPGRLLYTLQVSLAKLLYAMPRCKHADRLNIT